MPGDTIDNRMSRRLKSAAAALVVAALIAALASTFAQSAVPSWPDTFLGRLETLALMQTLNAEILASRSATASLEHWCRDHQGAADERIVADVVTGAGKAADADQRERLEVGGDEDVRYRRVRLRCGARVLSEAENWYVRGRLTPEMIRLLETTTTPFGRAVESLQPYRRTFSVTLLWTPAGRLGARSGVGAGANRQRARDSRCIVRAPRRALHSRPQAVRRGTRNLPAGDSRTAGTVRLKPDTTSENAERRTTNEDRRPPTEDAQRYAGTRLE